ncbi:MAG: His-Xaa-Ser system protein HxsD [Clostridia bacterium]|nr:His-Xaa-Ser system protein HxsD [Clostridia bacterium]
MEYKISKTIFNKEVILKVTYLWQEDFNINISEDENNYVLSVVSKTGTDFIWDKFNSELQEQQLKENLNNQFGTIRDAIYEKAFSHFKR